MKKIILLLILSSSFVFAKDLSVSLSPESSTVEAGKTARIRVNFSQAPKKFVASDISIEGGKVDSVRKLSASVYLAIVRASDDVREVELQIQADAIRDNQGDLNENASNSISIKVMANTQNLEAENKASAKKIKTQNDRALNSLLNVFTQSTKKNTPIAITPAPQVQYYNCNGQAIPTTQQCFQNTNSNMNNSKNVLYIPESNYENTYSSYVNNESQNYMVYPTALNPNYEAAYYNRHNDHYGNYPQNYYSSPYYEEEYGLEASLRGLLDW